MAVSHILRPGFRGPLDFANPPCPVDMAADRQLCVLRRVGLAVPVSDHSLDRDRLLCGETDG